MTIARIVSGVALLTSKTSGDSEDHPPQVSMFRSVPSLKNGRTLKAPTLMCLSTMGERFPAIPARNDMLLYVLTRTAEIFRLCMSVHPCCVCTSGKFGMTREVYGRPICTDFAGLFSLSSPPALTVNPSIVPPSAKACTVRPERCPSPLNVSAASPL